MGTNQNSIQRAEVCILAMMRALLNSTFDALVCIAIHSVIPPSYRDGVILPNRYENMHFIYADD